MRPDVASASGHGIRSSTNRCGQIKAGCLGPEIWIGQINAGWHQASMRCGDRLAVDTGGYLFLACLTGTGGGTVRDLVLGREAVFWVGSPHYLGIACGAALIVFFTAHLLESRYRAVLWLDAVALAVATAAGVTVAREVGASWPIVLVTGVATGTFGGMMRDVVANEVPMVLRQGELYVSAALGGAILSVVLRAGASGRSTPPGRFRSPAACASPTARPALPPPQPASAWPTSPPSSRGRPLRRAVCGLCSQITRRRRSPCPPSIRTAVISPRRCACWSTFWRRSIGEHRAGSAAGSHRFHSGSGHLPIGRIIISPFESHVRLDGPSRP
jgi:uncharacterized membrane protein YeiH